MNHINVDHQAPSDYAIQSIIDGVDQVALEMERKWGIGRFRLLVSDLLRAKYDAQCDKFNATIKSGKEAEIRKHGEAMKRAWKALDEAAIRDGHQPKPPEVWEVSLANGDIAAIVQDNADASMIPDHQPVFTLDEVGRLIDALGTVPLETKRIFPGAEVTKVHSIEAAGLKESSDHGS
ncbi:MAG: hypothetical protein QGI13_10075 [Rhodospirillales bacterium]|jgi:hypothetical protein|nr:hypothetical protein [Rhodospirillales bacterium]